MLGANRGETERNWSRRGRFRFSLGLQILRVDVRHRQDRQDLGFLPRLDLEGADINHAQIGEDFRLGPRLKYLRVDPSQSKRGHDLRLGLGLDSLGLNRREAQYRCGHRLRFELLRADRSQ
jgi:hypothetical protein